LYELKCSKSVFLVFLVIRCHFSEGSELSKKHVNTKISNKTRIRYGLDPWTMNGSNYSYLTN